jgi:3',5'-cyclic AMP phosphodiesterase CpdA
MNKNRKIIVFIVVIFTLCLIGYYFIAVKQFSKIKSGKEIELFIATDIHYLAKELAGEGQALKTFISEGDGKHLNYISEIMDAFTYDIKRKNPDILIISGDLTNNGEKKSHLELAKKLKDIEKTGTFVYVIPGNHDILNPYARGFKGDNQYKVEFISDKDFSRIYRDFGYGEAISKDKSTLSYLAAPSEDLWLLMLDTAQYADNLKNGVPQVDGKISDETLEWIKYCSNLAKKRNARIVTVMHHNLLDHSSVISKGFTINNKQEVLDKFQEYRLDIALSGHIHFQNIRSNKKVEAPNLKADQDVTYDIVTSALSVYPLQYGKLKYSPEDGYYYTTSQVDVEGWANKVGVVDKNLTGFKEYSKNAFNHRSYYKAYIDLLWLEIYTKEQMDVMSKTFAELNLKHFDGTANVDMDKIRNSPGFKLWEKASPHPLRRLVMNLANDGDFDNNKLYIPKNNNIKTDK